MVVTIMVAFISSSRYLHLRCPLMFKSGLCLIAIVFWNVPFLLVSWMMQFVVVRRAPIYWPNRLLLLINLFYFSTLLFEFLVYSARSRCFESLQLGYTLLGMCIMIRYNLYCVCTYAYNIGWRCFFFHGDAPSIFPGNFLHLLLHCYHASYISTYLNYFLIWVSTISVKQGL